MAGPPNADPADGRSAHERLAAGELFPLGDPEIMAGVQRGLRLAERYNAISVDDAAARQAALAEMLGSVGEGVAIRSPFHCDVGSNLRVGDHTFANFGLVVLDLAPVTIGRNVWIGPYVQLLTATHPIEPELRRGWERALPITIGDDVWLGGGVIVGPGVTIGEGSVAGAGAVVVRDVPPRVVVVGNPARVIRHV